MYLLPDICEVTLEVSLPHTEEACNGKTPGRSVEPDRGLQTGRCRSLCSTGAAVFESALSCQTGRSEGEQRGLRSGEVDGSVLAWK